MDINITLSKEEIEKTMVKVIQSNMTQMFKPENYLFNDGVVEGTKEAILRLVEKEKETILNLIIEKASKELVKKALPKLMASLTKID